MNALQLFDAGLVPAAFTAPVVQWLALSPLLVVFGAAVLGIILEAFLPAGARRPAQILVSLAALLGTLVALILRWQATGAGGAQAKATYLVQGELAEDPNTLALQGILVIIGILVILVVADRSNPVDGSFAAQPADRPGSSAEESSLAHGYQRTEMFPLILFSLGGMMVFVAASSLLTLFIALEVMSLPLYVLAAMSRRRRLLSQEAGFKYFLLGAFASGFFLMGMAMLYGYSGSVRLVDIMGSEVGMAHAGAGIPRMDWLLVVGFVMLLVGLLFKIGAVPFHAWTPDVYQGAPSAITGFMAAGVKVAAFGAIIRVIFGAGFGMSWDLVIFLWAVAVLTMLVGTFMGIVQGNVKRMLAYSSIAHAGFLLIGVLSGNQAGISAIAFYLLTYGVATVGAFALVGIVREKDAEGNVMGEAGSLVRWAGLGVRHPVMAVSMVVFLLSFAGIPLTAGFMGKFLVFAAGVTGGAAGLVVVAIVSSAVTAFFYFRMIKIMFFDDVDKSTVVVSGDVLSKSVVVVSAVVTVVLGVFPGPVMDVLNNAAMLLP
ncbi:MAG: NADH-quinone oxidoreductase subunit NuoN [Actinomycetaceae bacterium]|nr:NADH-quinone oxidoreductase subunit NuoN [Actinomycetaceae bacterium]